MSTNSSRIASQLLIASGLFTVSPAALADYECSKKETPVPAAQKELFGRALLAMKAALLPPPEGWTMSQPSMNGIDRTLCIDFKNDPLTFAASTTYFFKPTEDELRRYRAAQIAQRKEIAELRKLPPEFQAKVDALNAENTQVRKEAREAERAKNSELAKAKYAESNEISRKSYAVTSEYSTSIQAKERAIYQKYEPDLALNRDIAVKVSLTGNDAVDRFEGKTERIVFGSNVKTNQATDKLVRITARIEPSERASPAQVSLVRSFIEAPKLKAMVGGAIPDVEESKAAIAKQNEAIAALSTKARELEKRIEDESRRAEEAEQIAKRQATEAEKVGKAPAPAAAKPDSAAPAPTAVAAPKPATPTTPPPAANPADSVKDAKEAVNKLRGLFGR